jgi:transcriptional regulator with XRE-family HTH domain
MSYLKGFRKTKRLTQLEFGDEIGVSNTLISSIESGKTPLTDDTRDKILAKYGEEWIRYENSNIEPKAMPSASSDSWERKYYALLEKQNEILQLRNHDHSGDLLILKEQIDAISKTINLNSRSAQRERESLGLQNRTILRLLQEMAVKVLKKTPQEIQEMSNKITADEA